VCRKQVEKRGGGVQDNVTGLYIIHDAFVNAGLDVPRIKTYSGCCVGLRIGIDDQCFVFKNSQAGCEVNRGCGFANPSFLVGYSYDFSHTCKITLK